MAPTTAARATAKKSLHATAKRRNVAIALVAILSALGAGTASAGKMPVAWEPVDEADIAGYIVSSGPASGSYVRTQEVADVDHAVVISLPDCVDNYIVVASRAEDGSLSSTPSNEIVGWPSPRLSFVHPSVIPAGASAQLELYGANFKPGATITFGDPSIVVTGTTVVDCWKTLVQVEVDANAAVGATSDIELINPDLSYDVRLGGVRIGAPVQIDTPPDNDGDGDAGGGGEPDGDGGSPTDMASLSDGLIAHWTMDADSVVGTQLLDRSGNAHHGVIDGATLAAGRIGGALRFTSGEDDGVIVADSDLLDLGATFSIAAWIHADSYGENQNGVLLSKFNASRVEGWSFEISHASSRATQRSFGLTGQSVVYGQPDTTELGRWQHLALTYADGTLTFWVDGAVSESVAVMHDPNPGLRFITIGNDKLRGSDFDGLLDELRLYDRALSAAEVGVLAGQSGPPPCDDADGDGHQDASCGGDDCDDTTAAVFPGALEICGNWVDEDCDGGDVACPCADVDADGFTDVACGGNDCDDTDGAVHPGADETCDDGVDQDCDGTDTACPTCDDADGDGHLDAACGGTDCDDTDAATNPGESEICDGVDRDCDGVIDDGECDVPAGDELPPVVAHWTMDAESIEGEVLRDSGAGAHHGTIIGAEVEPGRHGQALRFRTGQNDYVVIPDADSLDLSGPAFTIAAWIYAETFGEAHQGALMSKWNASRTEGWELSMQSAGHQGLRMYGVSYQGQIDSADSVAELRRWQHVAAVHVDGLVTFWVDGLFAGSAPANHAPNPGLRNLYLGNDKSRTADFDGLIDDVRIWDGALPDAAIAALAAGESLP